MGQTIISLIVSVFILNVYHHHSNTSVPRSIKKVAFGIIATVFGMRGQITSVWANGKVQPEKNTKEIFTNKMKRDEVVETNVDDDIPVKYEYALPDDVIIYIRWLKSNSEDKEKERVIKDEWMTLGKILDRMFFFISLTVLVIEIAVLLINILK